MSEGEILGRVVRTGEHVTVGKSGWIVVSSSTAPWRNAFKVEHHYRPAREQTEIVLPETNVHFLTKGTSFVEWRLAGSTLHTRTSRVGDVGVISRNVPVWSRCFEATAMIIVSFNPRFLDAVARDSVSGAAVELQGLVHDRDRHIRVLGSLLEAETKEGCPNGRIYGESLATALAVHMLRRYAVFPTGIVEHKGGLSQHYLRRIVDYITSNLREDTSLQELADLVGISQYHFCRAFKLSMGLTPHQYILQVRIGEAKRLPSTTALDIDASHSLYKCEGRRLGYQESAVGG